MNSVRSYYYSARLLEGLAGKQLSDDGEYSNSSKMARLSFSLFHDSGMIKDLRKKNERGLELEEVISAKYPIQDFAEEYSVLPYLY
jgi:hypothetical protein